MFRKSCSIIAGLMVCLTLLFAWMAPSAQSQSNVANVAQVTITGIAAEDRPGKHPLITTYVSVLDGQGQHVSGLGAGDFEVREFTEEVSGISVSQERQGVAVELLVDVSGSMKGPGMSEDKLEDVQDAWGQFMEGLREEDMAGIFTFGTEVEQVQPLTSVREGVGSGITIEVPKDPALQYTCLFDAMWEAIEDLTSSEEEPESEFARMKKAVFVFSDGKDEGPCLHDLIDVKKLLIARDPKGKISVYAVGVGPEETGDFSDLRNLADITEGEFIHYFGRTEQEEEGTQRELNAAFDRFLTQGEQYVIRYDTKACADQVTLHVEVGGRWDEAEVQIPSVKPIIRLSSVEAGQRVSGILEELKPEFVLEQCPIRDVTYYVNGKEAGTFATPFTWNWDTSTLPDNENVGPVEVDAQGNGVIKDVAVRVVAVDQKGNSAEDEVSGLEVKILHPDVEVKILDPMTLDPMADAHIERTGRWRTELEDTTPKGLSVQTVVTRTGQRRAIERVEYYLDGQLVGRAASLDPYELDISALGSVDKEVQEIQYTLKVRVVDELGLFAEAEIPLTLSVHIETFWEAVGRFFRDQLGLIPAWLALVLVIALGVYVLVVGPRQAVRTVTVGVRKVTEFLGIATKGTRLILIEDGKDGRPYAVYDVTHMGRDESRVDIAFDHARVSRLHATLVKEDDDFVIYDQGSKNGTWINERRLPFKGHAVLETGDIVDLGQGGIRLRFEKEGEAAGEKQGPG